MAKPARAARGSLSAEAIEEVALRIADAEGLEALTMRRVAADLGVGAMSLYGYVRTKDELVERIAERALVELEIPERGPWDERLVRLFTDLRGLLWDHPAVLYANILRPLSGPGALQAANDALGILSEGGLRGADAVTGMSSLVAYTFGSAMFRLNRAGTSGKDYAWRIRGADPDELPHIAAFSEHLLERGSDAEFAAGLRLIVDGLARQAAEGAQ